MVDNLSRIAGLSPEKRAVLELLLKDSAHGQKSNRITRLPRGAGVNNFPLSYFQQRLWFLDQLEPNNPFYNMPLAFRLTGQLSLESLELSLSEIIRRHESLRTTFTAIDGEPMQVIAPNLLLPVHVVDLRMLPEAEREARELARKEAQRTFDLSRGPLLRTTLFRLADQDHMLLLTMHHIIVDEWSASLLFRELATVYKAYSTGAPSPLPELEIQYADYSVWQRERLQGEVLEKQLSYWRKQLQGAPAALELPTDWVRPAVQSYRGARQSMVLSEMLSKALNEVSRREGVTLFMTLIAAFKVLLSRHSGQQDIVIGTDVANRTQTETENLIGFFVNLLPIRTDLSGNPSFCELLQQVKKTTLGAFAHQDLPFEKLVEDLQPERDLSRNPLVQVLFVFQNVSQQTFELSDLHLSSMELGGKTSRFDLVLFMGETSEGLVGRWRYNTDLFEGATTFRLATHFQRLLESIVTEPETRVNSLEMLSEVEKEQQRMEKSERQEAQIRKLKSIRRKAVDLTQGVS